MEIARDYYLNKLIKKKGNHLIKVVTGVRRAGKSYLLNTLFRRHLLESGVPENHIIPFSFDSDVDLAKINDSLLAMNKEKRGANPERFIAYLNSLIRDENTYYLLLDEIQLLDSFEAVLNGYLRKDNCDVFVSGSNAKFLSKDVITEFAGRGDEITMFPCTFSEFMQVYEGDRYAGLQEYMHYGGIPMIMQIDDEMEKENALERLYQEIYIKDIKMRHHIKNTKELNELLSLLSSSVGRLVNPERLKKMLRKKKRSSITNQTVGKYLEYLDESFLIKGATRYDIKGKNYIETPMKYYFCDMGLMNAKIEFRQFDPNHIMENIIFNELIKRGYKVDVGVVPIKENNNGKMESKDLEVDFIVRSGSKRYYIQSAYAISDREKREKEIRPFKKIGDSFKKILVTADMFASGYDENGILTMNIVDFLLDAKSLDK